MEEFTFFERITRVLSMFFSSSFFIALFIIGVITVIAFLLSNKIDKENDYEYCIMTYNKDTKYLIILEFKY